MAGPDDGGERAVPVLTADLRARLAVGEPLIRLHDIEDKPWGVRGFAVIDPAGNAVRVGQTRDR